MSCERCFDCSFVLKIVFRDIGYVETLCPPIPGSGQNPPGSPSVFGANQRSPPRTQAYPPGPPQQQSTLYNQPSPYPHSISSQNNRLSAISTGSGPTIQGFIPRDPLNRRSSAGSTTTTTTADFSMNQHPNNGRVVPGTVAFPTPNPGGSSQMNRSASIPNSIGSAAWPSPDQSFGAQASPRGEYDKYPMNEQERNQRYSTATDATFGNWDRGLKSANGQVSCPC